MMIKGGFLLYAEGIWFFIKSKMRKDADFGYWRTKGEACQIFSNSSITGWRSTLEFYEGQAPLGNKTDWVMQEYWITRKILSIAKVFATFANPICLRN